MSRGRGRGRGRGAGRSPLLDALPKGEMLPPPILQPPPAYPLLERRPLGLKANEEDSYLITVKRDFRQFMQASPYFVKRTQKIQESRSFHYTDVFNRTSSNEKGTFRGWEPNWSLFPLELCPVKTKRRKIKTMKIPKESASHIYDLSALNEPKGGDDSDSKSSGGEEDAPDETLEYDEEEEEEGGDYTTNYFDDGGDDGGGDEDDALEDREGAAY